MSYASKAGRARISSSNPQALAICDRCGLTYNHCDLNFQYDWAGAHWSTSSVWSAIGAMTSPRKTCAPSR